MSYRPPQRALTFSLQVFKHVFGGDAGSDKFDACFSHLRQQAFAGLVDESEVAQIHYRPRSGSDLAGVAPAGTKLVYPRPRELTTQIPALARVRLRVTDPQHDISLSSRRECMRSANAGDGLRSLVG